MNKRIRKVLAAPAILSAAISLSACAGSAPAPCTESGLPQEQSVPSDAASVQESSAGVATEVKSSDSKQADASTAGEVPQAAAPVKPSSAAAESKKDPAAVSAAATVSGSSSASSSATSGSAIASSSADTANAILPPDPYVAFPALASEILAFADSLYKQGKEDSASAYLERFRVIKPLWNQWEAQADSMLNEFGKTRAEKAKAFEPMVLEIQNMNRAQAAYSLVSEAVDSLIAKAPGDSLVSWAGIQKQTAYTNTLSKAKKEFEQINNLANSQAKFAEALKKAEEFLLRYSDFADTLKVQEFIDKIRNMAESADSEAVKYWESHDPADALKKAKELIEKSKFAEAKEILNKLKVSSLRKEAMEEYNKLADAFCNAERKTTSQLFAKAQKQKDAAKKKQLLKDAIAPLDRCIQEYPEYNNMQKVLDNKTFLEKEIDR